MSVLNSRPVLRWIVPAAAALAVIGGGAAIGALTAAADPRLAQRSAAQLLVDVQTARLDGLSGTVVQRADLGLPAILGLAGQGGRGSSDLTSLVNGTHTLRVWYAGPDKARVALLGTLGETDVIRNGRDLWIWQSRDHKASHRTLPAGEPGAGAPSPPSLTPGEMPMTPQQLADAALAALSPTTEVRVDDTTRVAGRDTYQLTLAPRDRASLVAAVRVAIDAKEHVPLRVQVFAKGGGDPAIEVAFTQVSFARPDPEQFNFNPPPGTTVTEEGGADKGNGTAEQPGAVTPNPEAPKPDATKPDGSNPDAPKPDATKPSDRTPGLTVVGQGWTSVLVARLPEEIAGETGQGGARRGEVPMAMLEQLPEVSGSWGSGRLLTSKLFSALLTSDGRVLIGAVSPERLYEAVVDPAAQLPR
jgi:outer membrane lipoprotein-sorting protein